MPTSQDAGEPIAVCFSYHRSDEQLLESLHKQLAVLRQQARISVWYAGLRLGGDLAEQEIMAHLESAQIILLLISPDYMSDHQCYEQMLLAIQRQQAGLAHVLPILLRPTSYWEQTALGTLEPLPTAGRPVTRWANRDEALKDVAEGVGAVIQLIEQKRCDRPAASTVDMVQDMPPPYNHSALLQREGLVRDLYAKLLKPDVSAIVLRGLGGVGKSTLAAQIYHYAEEQRLTGDSFFNGEAIWLSIKPTMTFQSLVMRIAAATGQLSDSLRQPLPEELAQKLWRLLNDSKVRRLIVLDGFEAWLNALQGDAKAEYAGVSAWLDLLNNHPCTCRILMTARIMPQGTRIYRQMYTQDIFLEGLTQEEGTALLHMWGVQATDQDLASAVALCKGHPFALLLLDSLLRSRRMQLATLLEEPVYKRLWVNNVEHALFNDIYEPFDALQRNLLQAFAIYRQAVPWRAAYALLKGKRQLTEERFQEALGVLLAQALLQIDSDGQGEYYRLHPLVAELVLRHFSAGEQGRGNINKPKAHLKAALYYRQQYQSRSTALQRRDEAVSMVIEAIWHYCQAQQWQTGYELLQQEQVFTRLMRQGQYMVLLELYKLFLNADRWQPEHKIAALLYNEAGEIYNRLGAKGEAEGNFAKALELARTAGSSALEVKALNNLGAVYRSYEWTEKALECYQRAMHICAQAQEPVEKGVTLNNIGRVFQDMGQAESQAKKKRKYYRNALTHYKQALDVHMYAHDQVEAARTRNNLGEISDRLGSLAEADLYYRQALEGFQGVGEKRDEGIVYNNLGTLYRKLEKHAEAFDYYVRALRIFQRIGARWDEAFVLRNLGYLFLFSLRNDVALACFLLASNIYEALHQPGRATLPRGIQSILAGKQSFESMKAAIYPMADEIVEKALKQGI